LLVNKADLEGRSQTVSSGDGSEEFYYIRVKTSSPNAMCSSPFSTGNMTAVESFGLAVVPNLPSCLWLGSTHMGNG
jgi:hypothetical protein